MTDENQSASNEDERILTLKNGVAVPARPAYVDWLLLQGLSRVGVADVESLWKIADQKLNELAENEYARVQQEHPAWFNSVGQMEPQIRDLVLNSVRRVPDGIVVVNPFKLETVEQRQLFSDLERSIDGQWKDISQGDDGQSEGLSR